VHIDLETGDVEAATALHVCDCVKGWLHQSRNAIAADLLAKLAQTRLLLSNIAPTEPFFRVLEKNSSSIHNVPLSSLHHLKQEQGTAAPLHSNK
jgi:hypothetical protein